MSYSKEDFGDSFQWGVSTAAYQIEGGHDAHGKGSSIWDEFVKSKGKIQDGTHANVTCNHYEHLAEDVGIISRLNISNYRFSLSWSRIFPEGIGKVNEAGVAFYNRLIDECLANNITPWVTLYHWDLPLALELKGGWTDREVLNWFEEYVTFCVRTFGDRVKNWMILNEPMVFTGAGYFLGYHAPGKKGLNNFIPAMHHAALSQSLGGRIVRDELPEAKIGTTFSCSHVVPNSDNEKDIAAAKRFDALLNRLYIEPALGLGYPVDDLPIASRVEKFLHPQDENNLPFNFDFIGVQNYTQEVVKHVWFVPYLQGQIVEAQKRNVSTTTMGWEVSPISIYHMLKKYSQYENAPELMVTENGAAFPDVVEENKIKDVERTKFLQAYIKEVLRAKKEGVNVNGYFIWTLMDNFEWAEGYKPRFGLVHTDFETQKRTIKDSGFWYSRFLKSAKVHSALEVG